MKRVLAALAAAALVVAPAMAQSKLDQAIDKAYEQLQNGKPDEAVKTLTKAAEQAGAEGQVALARLQERIDKVLQNAEERANLIKAVFDEKIARLRKGDELPRIRTR